MGRREFWLCGQSFPSFEAGFWWSDLVLKGQSRFMMCNQGPSSCLRYNQQQMLVILANNGSMRMHILTGEEASGDRWNSLGASIVSWGEMLCWECWRCLPLLTWNITHPRNVLTVVIIVLVYPCYNRRGREHIRIKVLIIGACRCYYIESVAFVELSGDEGAFKCLDTVGFSCLTIIGFPHLMGRQGHPDLMWHAVPRSGCDWGEFPMDIWLSLRLQAGQHIIE